MTDSYDLNLGSRHNRVGGPKASVWHIQPPIRAFKHVHPDWAEQFKTGSSIQVGIFESYRNEEDDRGDPLEGIARNRSGDGNLFRQAYYGVGHADEMMNVFFGPEWRQIDPRSNVVMHNITIEYAESQRYIFCASSQPDLSRLDSGERIFLIHDLLEFGAQLCRSRPDLFDSLDVGSVIYENRDVDVTAERMRHSSPFLKSDRFRHEKEVRIVFSVKDLPSARVNISCPYAANLITEIFGPFEDMGRAQYVNSSIT